MAEPVIINADRDVWGADQLQDIIERNVKWLQEFIVVSVKSLRKDGRPIFTAKMSKQQRLAKLLEAGPEFWAALQAQNPEVAAKLAADMLRARAKGTVPRFGPRSQEAEEMPEEDLTGTEPASPLPEFVDEPTEIVA